jgi:hypothetical protein
MKKLILGALMLTCVESFAAAPEAPESLRPVGQELVMELLASGVQVYECVSNEWKFKAPEATLMDRAGRPMGTHYGGPTWKAPDGSAVVGEVRAKAPAAAANAIPLLLLGAKSTSGEGAFARVSMIQRLETAGGVAPARPCTASQASEVARVPYTATYYFYTEK